MGTTAQIFKALGDQTRLTIVAHLLQGEECACKFGGLTGRDQTTVSRHLAILVNAGILSRERRGKNIYYAISNLHIKRLLKNAEVL